MYLFKYDKINENKEEYDKTPEKYYQQLLIVDDCGASLKNIEVEEMLAELSMNRRHLNLSIIVLVQYLRNVPCSVRSQVSTLVVFNPAINLDYKKLKEEFINLPNNIFMRLMKYVFNEPHDNLIVSKRYNTLYKNLQKININETK